MPSNIRDNVEPVLEAAMAEHTKLVPRRFWLVNILRSIILPQTSMMKTNVVLGRLPVPKLRHNALATHQLRLNVT